MEQAATKKWLEGTTVDAPCIRRPDSLWRDIHTEEQERIATTLRGMYDELVE
jgi:hypothetical protein